MRRHLLRHLTGTLLLGCIVTSHVSPGCANASPLITEDEAKLPPPRGAVAAERRGIMRAPKVKFVSPADSAQSPLHLQLEFEAFGGAKVDPDSVKVTFLRTPNVDLTLRVKPFVQANGIDMPDTEVPPGEYIIRVDIKDSDGRPGTTSFILKVSP